MGNKFFRGCLVFGILIMTLYVFLSGCVFGTGRQIKLFKPGIPLLKGMTYVGENHQGYSTYRHEQTEMIFILIPGGTFLMGSNNGEDNEKPVHEITINGFLLAQYEVTQEVWQKIMGDNVAYFKNGNDYPIEQISWLAAQQFCKMTNLRLPTEAEWEYACRGPNSRSGINTNYYWGDKPDGKYMWYRNNSNLTTHPVGRKKPNGFGLYDMSGNVWEWCSDWWREGYYSSTPKRNPKESEKERFRVLRGGAWLFNADYCRSSYRLKGEPMTRVCSFYIGFRCAKNLVPINSDGITTER